MTIEDSSPGRLAAALRCTPIRQLCETTQFVASAWNQFWYTPSSPLVLGVMRLLVGAMLVYTHLVWGLNLPAFFGSAGWNSPAVLEVVQSGQFAPSFWWYVPDPWLMPVHAACIVILVCFWLGFATRLTSILSMIITVSYAHRAHMANFGLDQINAILCLYLCIGPSGAVLSIDRWLALRRARLKTRSDQQSSGLPPVKSSVSANLAIRLAQVHFCVIYAYSGLSKLQGGAWWSGEATWLAFANLEYQSLDMTWIAWFPWISDLMTHTTILWEVSFAALVWVRPIRPLVLAMGFAMHAGIGGMMGMWTFGLIMIFGHVSFWPVETVQWILGRGPWLSAMAGIVPSVPENSAPMVRQVSSRPSPASQPGLLWIDRAVRRRLRCLNYFWRRGVRCLATDDMHEAHAVRDATSPDAVILMGADLPDEDVAAFHERHCSRPDAQPLFLVLTEAQSTRLNGRIHTLGSHILTGRINLRSLHREIEETLSLSTTRVQQKAVEANQPVGANE